MEVIYDNGFYNVVANPYEHCYYVISNSTQQVESTEKAEPTALYKADALREVKLKWNARRDEKDRLSE